ncbi:MAG: hypothetical protein KFKLKKLM_01134 [Flavobacteriales bacterium]|nr:hypothetical protein [Flavobacteriales bacterium]
MPNDFKKFDHIIIGLILGVILPVTTMYVILKITTNMSLFYIYSNPFFSPIINSLKGGLLVNLGIFFLFYWLKKDQSAKGVIAATFVYGAFYLWYMFFM